MSDPAIIEAAARALLAYQAEVRRELTLDDARIVMALAAQEIEAAYVRSRATIHVAAIRNTALEEAAQMAENYSYHGLIAPKGTTAMQIAVRIRALREQP